MVAANRDEFYDRPARAPLLWTEGAVKILAPRDEQAGGTWIGFNSEGVFAGITNRFGAAPVSGARSRGELVLRALSYGSAEEARQSFLRDGALNYCGFNLAVIDRQSGFLLWMTGDENHIAELSPGLHILTERSLGTMDVARERVIRAKIKASADVDSMLSLLSIHHESLGEGTCLHGDTFGYGTRSSMVVDLDESWALRDARYSEGHPCNTRFEDFSELFHALDGRYSLAREQD